MSSLKVYREKPDPEPEPFVVPDFGGDACVVVVYQHNFSGWHVVFGEGDFNLKAFKDAGAVNDDTSSIQVRGKHCNVMLY
jgi:hypothetical protein